MNKPTPEEAVSALLDDALSRHEVDLLLEQLRHAPYERARMERYSLIGMASWRQQRLKHFLIL